MLVPQNLANFTEWTIRQTIQLFHLSELWGGEKKKSHFIQEVQPYTSPKNSLDTAYVCSGEINRRMYKMYIPSTFQCQDHRCHCGCCTDMAHKVLSECEALLHWILYAFPCSILEHSSSCKGSKIKNKILQKFLQLSTATNNFKRHLSRCGFFLFVFFFTFTLLDTKRIEGFCTWQDNPV